MIFFSVVLIRDSFGR